MKKFILYVAVAVLFFAGCEKDAEVRVPAHESRLVINGEHAQNDLFGVRIGRSVGINETIPQNATEWFNVADARVLLKQNDIIADTLKYNSVNRRYEGTKVRAAIGNTYTIVATAPGLGQAEGSSYLPALVEPSQALLRRKVRTDEYGAPVDEVTITFKDDPTTQNYYLIRIKGARGEYVLCASSNDKDVERPVSGDPFNTNECLYGNRLLLSDRNFNGSTKTILFNIISVELDEFIDSQGRRLKPTIELLHITPDYFRYLKSLAANDNAEDNPFAEPVNVFTNIKNGYGIFTTYAIAVDTLR